MQEDTKQSQASKKPQDKVVEQTDKSEKKPWYKRRKFWAISTVIVVILAGLTAFLISRHNMNTNKTAISDGWHAIVLSSQTVVVTADRTKSSTNADDLNKDLNTLSNTVKDQVYKSDKLSTFLTSSADKAQWKKFLADYGAYVDKLVADTDNIADFTTDQYDELKKLSDVAKQTTSTTKSSITYLSEDVPAGMFTLYNTLDTIKTNIDEQQSAAKAAKDKASAQAAQDAVDKATAEKNVTTFEAAYIAADAAKMKTVMTSGFISEYDFNTLSATSRKYNYPDSFRIIDSKKDNGNYLVRVNMVYKNRDDAGVTTGQYTTGSTFTVTPSSGKWLINSEKQESAY